MEQERKRAAAIGYEDPINPTYEATSQVHNYLFNITNKITVFKMYQRCLNAIVDEWELRGKNNVAVMVASHNLETVRYAVNLMKERGIAPSERVICFGQLFGMCDIVGSSLNYCPKLKFIGLFLAWPSRIQRLQIYSMGTSRRSYTLFVTKSTRKWGHVKEC